MAALPKIIYNGIRVQNLCYNGQEIFNLTVDGQVRYHKHRGNSSTYGGCYTVEKTKTESIDETHHWRVTGRGETVNWSGEIVQGEGETHYIMTTYPVEDEHGHQAEITWCSHADGARETMKHSWEFMNNGEYGNAGGKLTEEPLGFTFTTAKTTVVTTTYYDLGCGFSES